MNKVTGLDDKYFNMYTTCTLFFRNPRFLRKGNPNNTKFGYEVSKTWQKNYSIEKSTYIFSLYQRTRANAQLFWYLVSLVEAHNY